jgi:hypothetical protein
MAFMDGAWPDEHAGHAQPVQTGGPVFALVNLKSDHGAAMAISGQAVELARTAIGAIAVGKFVRPDNPIGHDQNSTFQIPGMLADPGRPDEQG